MSDQDEIDEFRRDWEEQEPTFVFPDAVEKALDELVKSAMENLRRAGDSFLRPDEVRESIVGSAIHIRRTPHVPNKQRGGRGGRLPGFDGLRPEQVKAAYKRIEKAANDVLSLGNAPALLTTRTLLETTAGARPDEPFVFEYLPGSEVNFETQDIALLPIELLSGLLESFVRNVKLHLAQEQKRPFRNRERTEQITSLLRFVRGNEEAAKPLYAAVSRFLKAYMKYRNPGIKAHALAEFEPAQLKQIARRNMHLMRKVPSIIPEGLPQPEDLWPDQLGLFDY